MKKILSVILIIILMLSAVACTNEKETKKYCSSCGGSISASAAFCEHCGANVLETAAFCSSCGSSLNNNSVTVTATATATEKPTVKPTVRPTVKPTARPATPILDEELYIRDQKDMIQYMVPGETRSLFERVINETKEMLEWESTDTSIATVNKFGYVTAKAGGVTKITATNINGKSVSILVYVYEVRFPSTPFQIGNNDYVSIKITNIKATSADNWRIKITIEGEIVSSYNVHSMDFYCSATDPNGNTCENYGWLQEIPTTKGTKFNKEAYFDREEFGVAELVPGKYTTALSIQYTR